MPHYINPLGLFRVLLAVTVSQVFFLLTRLTVLRRAAVFGRMSLIGDWPDVFIKIRLDDGF